MKSAQVVIIGGGVMGASLAFHLASRGCTDVYVLESSDQPGMGSTGKATGGFRAQFGTEVNVRLSLLAREKLIYFKDETGLDPGLRQVGYLFLASHIQQLEALRAAQAIQKSAGLDEVNEVDLNDISRINPSINLERIIGGVFCASDGFIKPLQILRGYKEAAERLGVKFSFGVKVTGFDLTKQNHITGVRTSEETISTAKVVNAAGAWASVVAQWAGLNIPIEPVTQLYDLLSEDTPMTIFVEDGFHFRARDGRVLLLLATEHHACRGRLDVAFDETWLDIVVPRAHACVPCLKDVPIDRECCWAGLYEMSPDKHALVGLAPGFDNFYLMNGSSGHGVMHAPALGHLLAEIILDGKAQTLPIDELSPSRFREGKPNPVLDFL